MIEKLNEETRPEPEFSVFDPQRFLGLDEMGLRVLSWRRLGRPDGPGLRQIRCEPDSHDARWCPSCGAYARVRSSWLRTLAHVPYGDDAVHLLVRVRRYECVPCSRSWSDDLEAVGAGRGVLSVPAVMWALRRVCLDSMTVSACARLLHVAWAVVDGRCASGACCCSSRPTGSPRCARSAWTSTCGATARSATGT